MKLPPLRPENIPPDQIVRHRVNERQQVSVDSADSTRKCTVSDFLAGDQVLVKEQ